MTFLTTVVKILENVVFSGLLSSTLCLKNHEDTSLFHINPNFFLQEHEPY